MLASGHRAAGVVVISMCLSAAQFAELAEAGVHVVLVDVPFRGVPHTVVDDVRGGMLATSHLIALGHRRVGFIGDTGDGGLGFSSISDRLRGYRRALAMAGAPIDLALVSRGSRGFAAAAEHGDAPVPPAGTTDRGLRHSSDGSAVRGGGGRTAGSGRTVGDRLRRHRDSGVRRPVHGPAAAAGERCARCRAPVRALLRGGSVRPLRETLPLEVVARRTTSTPRARSLSPQFTALPERAPP
jgi:LacI family transcriptional regulator